jgi:hypothetical protein
MLFQAGKLNGSRNKVEKNVHVDVEYEARVVKDELSTAIRFMLWSCAPKMEAVCYSEDIAATYWSKQEFTQKNTVLRSSNVFQILYKTV